MPAVVLAIVSNCWRIVAEFHTGAKKLSATSGCNRNRIKVSGYATGVCTGPTIPPNPTSFIDPLPRETKKSPSRIKNRSASWAVQAPFLDSLWSICPCRKAVRRNTGKPPGAVLTDRPFERGSISRASTVAHTHPSGSGGKSDVSGAAGSLYLPCRFSCVSQCARRSTRMRSNRTSAGSYSLPSARASSASVGTSSPEQAARSTLAR